MLPVSRRWLVLLAVLAVPLRAAELELPAVFGDHAVLQCGAPLPVWGRATPGDTVTVTFAGQEQQAVVAADGTWRITLKPLPASGEPRELVVSTTKSGRRTLTDMLVGEVWFCSGQSNMEMNVAMSRDGAREVAAANFPQMRLFSVLRTTAAAPAFTVVASWDACAPETVANFSAAAYYLGRELHRELKVPVGLIAASWGGSRIQSWTPRPALAALPALQPALAKLDAEIAADTLEQAEQRRTAYAARVQDYEKRQDEFWAKLDEGDDGAAAHWEAPATDDQAWDRVAVPGVWELYPQPGYEKFDGLVWFRRRVTIPAAWAGQALTLGLCTCDDSDTAYFNGVRVGRTTGNWWAPRRYTVPAELVRAGEAVIAVRIMDVALAGGFAGGPRELFLAPAGATATAPLSLAGEWRCRRSALAKWPALVGQPQPPEPPGGRHADPGAMFYGMVAPVAPYAVRGVAWYQGESNANEAELYAAMLPAMITAWRQAWQQPALPFGIVQLPLYLRAKPDDPAPGGGWALLREAQAHVARTVPGVGLAITLDLGEADNIHPLNKQDVGKRLALWALARLHGRDVPYCGPLFRAMQVADGKAVLEFDHATGGLTTRDAKPPAGLAIAGADGKFVWAQARIEGEKLVVWADAVPAPVAVRYAWADHPASANLVNRAGLPAAPCRTDLVAPGRK